MLEDNLFNKVRALISAGEPYAACEVLRDFLGGQADQSTGATRHANEVIVQMSRIVRANKSQRSGHLSSQEFERTIAAVSSSILELVDEIKRANIIALWPAKDDPVHLSTRALGTPEIVLGRISQLKSLSWLHQGLVCAKSVCRVVGARGVGTGFVVGSGILLTNHHVIGSQMEAAGATLEFNFEESSSGKLLPVSSYPLDSSNFFTSERLDCTAVKIVDTQKPVPVREWGALGVSTQGVELEDHVTIIQHPQGGLKKICLTENKVVNIADEKLQYTTDTMPGSSGSPVFNDQWQVVAIHHAGGNLIKNAHGVSMFANQGILMSSILAQREFRKCLLGAP